MLRIKKTDFIKTVKSAQFIGRQLSRLKLGQSYYSIIVSTLSAISLISLAFNIEFWMIILIFPIILLAAFIIGYFLDVFNINTMDTLKSNEITHRFLTTSDIKHQEFVLLQTEILLEALRALQENRKIEPTEILKKYESYYKKWKPPSF
ncbi:MAG: hypothetical protein ACTSU4_12515 [Promethearchaeota archaeon]